MHTNFRQTPRPLSTKGGGSDVIASSSGTETLNGGNGNDLLFGNGGADTINGENGADLLVGGAGADILNGGAGNDVLFGGVDNDTFLINTALNAATNVDTITDFNLNGIDKIHLENTGAGLFNALATGALSAGALDIVGAGAAADANTRIIYDPATGALYYDADGVGGVAAVQFATLGTTTHPTTVASTDFVVI